MDTLRRILFAIKVSRSANRKVHVAIELSAHDLSDAEIGRGGDLPLQPTVVLIAAEHNDADVR